MTKPPKRGAKAESAGKRAIKDLTARSGKQVTGGRQTAKTDFGSVLGQGISKAADQA